MQKLIVTIKTERFNLKTGTKGAFALESTTTEQGTMTNVDNIVGSLSFFRRLGGSEYLVKSYTCAGFVPVVLTSKNPERTVKVVRSFTYEYATV